MTAADEIRAFLRAIAAAPDEDLPRLAFADWLDEHGRPERAEFIRVEVAMARTEPGDPRRGAMFARRDELFRAHSAEWFALFAGKAATWATERGFVTDVHSFPETFLANATDWFATQPITRLRIADVWAGPGDARRCMARELLTSEHLARLTHLNLERAGVNSAGVYWLSRNADLGRLRDLNLRGNRIGDNGAGQLAGLAALAGLESLDLVDCGIFDAGARALIGSPHLGNLRELRLTHNAIRNRAWRELEKRFGRALAG